jgi:dephospho-CoA kinase
MKTKNKPEKLVLGFVGEMACGKGTAAAYCKKKYGAPALRFSTILRDMADRVYLEHSRNNLILISEIIRKTFGDDIMAHTMAKDVEAESKKFITVDGIRRPADIVHLKKFPNFYLVEIKSEPRTRYERIVKRTENSDDKSKTWSQFQKDSKRSTEVTIRKVAKNADFVLDNNGTFKQFYTQIDKIVKEIRKK